jgi:ribosomal protein S18 acetylase RimI-like enzyme
MPFRAVLRHTILGVRREATYLILESTKDMAEGDITIRPATADDLPAVRALLAETWHDTYDALMGADWVTEVSGRWHSIENLRRQIETPDTSFLVAVDQGKVIGHILADARKPPVLVVGRLYVLPAHQRGGIGARLLAAAIAEHPACERLRLEVEAGNEKGIAFYRRAGCEEVGRSVVEGSEHLVMEKALNAGG